MGTVAQPERNDGLVRMERWLPTPGTAGTPDKAAPPYPNSAALFDLHHVHYTPHLR